MTYPFSDTQRERFFHEYRKQLEFALVNFPQEYTWPASELDTVFAKMRVAIEKGSANKDSRAIKATCKALGIKHTYTAIREYLGVAR